MRPPKGHNPQVENGCSPGILTFPKGLPQFSSATAFSCTFSNHASPLYWVSISPEPPALSPTAVNVTRMCQDAPLASHCKGQTYTPGFHVPFYHFFITLQ